MLRSAILLCLSVARWLCAQPADSKPAFEVATIKSSTPGTLRPTITSSAGGPGTDDPGRVTFQAYSLLGLVAAAYRVDFYQVSGPNWLETEKYDIVAKVPEGATKEQAPLMLRNLLMERFHLAAHLEKKEGPVYDLVVAKNGPKMKESPKKAEQKEGADAQTAIPKVGPDGFPVFPPGRGFRKAVVNGNATARFTDASMAQLVNMLAGELKRPVTDATGLTGKYDFELHWTAGMFGQPGDDVGPTLFEAVQQLGLKLEQKKGLVDLVVVDHMEKTPTEN